MNECEQLYGFVWGKRRRGRPSRFTLALAERIYFLARYGATDAEIAWTVGIGESTLHRWKLGSETFKRQLQAAKAVADAEVERCLFNRVRGMTVREKTIEKVMVGERVVATRQVLVEQQLRDGSWSGHTENYLPVRLRGQGFKEKNTELVRISSREGLRLL